MLTKVRQGMSASVPVVAHAGRCRKGEPGELRQHYADTLSLQPGLSYGAGRMQG
jgi:hypothetical protein